MKKLALLAVAAMVVGLVACKPAGAPKDEVKVMPPPPPAPTAPAMPVPTTPPPAPAAQ